MINILTRIADYEQANDVKLHINDIRDIFRAYYDTEYGICIHPEDNKERPLSTVAFHPIENINKDSLLDQYMDVWLDLNIKNIWGETFEEFINCPMDIFELKIDKATRVVNKNAQQQSQTEQQLNQVMKSIK